jgi:KDO2-lipid IV(A) lauroyltransferase
MASKITLAHRAQYAALRSVIGSLRYLSWERAAEIGAQIGRLGYWPLGIRRDVTVRQIAAAFPDLARSEVERIARGSYENLGRVSVEAALLSRLGASDVTSIVSGIDGWEVIERTTRTGKGLILVTGHFGNWELCAAYMAAVGMPMDAVARRMNNPLFDGYLTRTRARLGITVIHDREAVRRVPRTVKEGGLVGFVMDQGVLNLASSYVPFFGRPAKTPRGPAVFALKFDVPVVFGAAIRQPDGRYRGVVEEVKSERTGERDADVEALVAAYTAVLEKWIRTAPEQYFWQHRRWKWQPEDTPAALRDPSVATAEAIP